MKTKLSFDGKGVNDRSEEYAPRVATFTTPEYADRYGALFAAAPELLEALKILLHAIQKGERFECIRAECGCGGNERPKRLIAAVIASINKAEGREE